MLLWLKLIPFVLNLWAQKNVLMYLSLLLDMHGYIPIHFKVDKSHLQQAVHDLKEVFNVVESVPHVNINHCTKYQ